MILAQAVLQLFCSQGCFTILTFYRILPKVNQVIYTLAAICMPNIMILAQVVLHVFCSQGPLWLKCLSMKRGIIQSNIHRILWKPNQIIYLMYSNCLPDIMIQAQMLLQIFCSQGCFTIQNASQKRGIIQPNIYRILLKVNQVMYTLDPIYMPNIMILAQAVLQIFCSQCSIRLQCKSRKNSQKRGITQE